MLIKNKEFDKQQEEAYWNQFYINHHRDIPTPFAKFCLQEILSPGAILEFGCGNGRDALYFAAQGFQVTGIDSAYEIISHLNERLREFNPSLKFICQDFSSLSNEIYYDVIYSRFTLHAVNKIVASRALQWAYNQLKKHGKICIEARSIKDSLYGQGTEVEKDAFITTHYRRFIRLPELLEELNALGFAIIYSIESAGLAVYGNEDPVVIRVIAEK